MELEEFTAPMVNRWPVKQFHRCFTGNSPVFFTNFVSKFEQEFPR